MTEHDSRLLRLVRQALEVEPAFREGFLDEQCAADSTLRRKVGDLLHEAQAIEHGTATEVGGQPGDRLVEDLADPLLGTRLGAFRLRERIGRGGMGVVYRGE